ncbi:DUF4817 domain-containing protein [Trichonephila clavipes]|nr:DUF4817 domain-containing protein [Trichonephila clavipes]
MFICEGGGKHNRSSRCFQRTVFSTVGVGRYLELHSEFRFARVSSRWVSHGHRFRRGKSADEITVHDKRGRRKKAWIGLIRRDEAHFWLNGYVNKQNCRIWSEANPQVYVETPLHSEKLTVWCALWAGGIIGPYFFKNDEGHNELWFQQDGATCHTARATIYLLKDTLGDRLISRFGPVNWPPRSCDLTPLDYFLWGYVKSLVYADKPQTLDHLEDNIRRVIADIRPQMLEKVIENWTSRLDYIRASRGSHMPEIIFKILTGDSKRVYIWRESGTRNDPSNIVERDRFGSGGVMVGGIMIDGRTPLHVFKADL